jgi:hypothetical protein
LPWPWLLRQQSPALFDIWWTAELASLTSRRGFSLGHLELLAWASWPVLPLAVWSLWLERRQLLKAETAMLLAATAVALLMFLSGPSTRPTALFPALVPLAVLAASAAGRLRRGAANALDWFGMMTFTQTAALLWLGGIAILSGTPARIAKNFSKLAPGFIAEVSITERVTVASAPTFARRSAPVPAASPGAAWGWRSAPRSTTSTASAPSSAAAPRNAAG